MYYLSQNEGGSLPAAPLTGRDFQSHHITLSPAPPSMNIGVCGLVDVILTTR